MSKRLSKQELLDISRRAADWIAKEGVPVVSDGPPSPGDTIEMVDEILDWRRSMRAVIDGTFDDTQHCTCVPYLRRRIETLEDAIHGAVDHPDLNGPDILEEAADMLEERTITLASQLRKTARMQREALRKGETND